MGLWTFKFDVIRFGYPLDPQKSKFHLPRSTSQSLGIFWKWVVHLLWLGEMKSPPHPPQELMCSKFDGILSRYLSELEKWKFLDLGAVPRFLRIFQSLKCFFFGIWNSALKPWVHQIQSLPFEIPVRLTKWKNWFVRPFPSFLDIFKNLLRF